jgi:hypothetical protein
MERLVWTVREVAEQLGIGERAAYSLCRRIGIKIGQRLLVSKARLAAYLAEERDATDLSQVGRR